MLTMSDNDETINQSSSLLDIIGDETRSGVVQRMRSNVLLLIVIELYPFVYSRLSLSRSRKHPLKHFEISVLRHIRFAELRKIPNEQPNLTNEHVI